MNGSSVSLDFLVCMNFGLSFNFVLKHTILA